MQMLPSDHVTVAPKHSDRLGLSVKRNMTDFETPVAPLNTHTGLAAISFLFSQLRRSLYLASVWVLLDNQPQPATGNMAHRTSPRLVGLLPTTILLQQ